MEIESVREISIVVLQKSHETEYTTRMEIFGVKTINYFMVKVFKESAHPK